MSSIGLDMPAPAVLKDAKALNREDVRRELLARGMKPSGILQEDVSTLQSEYQQEYDHEVNAQAEKIAAATARLEREQAELRAKSKAAQELREEQAAISANPRFKLFLKCAEANETNRDVAFAGATSPMARSLLKVLPLCTSLLALDLSNGQLGDKGGSAIASILESNNVLRKLELENNGLGSPSAEALGSALQTNTGLSFLSLENNSLTSDRREWSGVKALTTALTKNRTLTALNVARTDLGAQGGELFSDALNINATVIILDLDHNVGIKVNDLQLMATKLDENRARRAALDERENAERKDQLVQQRLKAAEDEKLAKAESYQKEVEEKSEQRKAQRMANLNEERAAKSKALQEARLAAYKKHEDWVAAEEAAKNKKKKKKKK